MGRATLGTLRARAAACGWRSVVTRTLVLAAGWWILDEGDLGGLVFGGFVVLAAVIVSVLVASPPAPAWHPIALLRFAFVFIAGSIRGGFDVAWSAMAPRMRIAPYVTEYQLRLPEGMARNLLLGTCNLMPGTLTLACEGRRLDLHVIAVRGEVASQLAALEASIAAALGVRLEEARA
jgi:multicomponent Na+:H+ antiporter subunit E